MRSEGQLAEGRDTHSELMRCRMERDDLARKLERADERSRRLDQVRGTQINSGKRSMLLVHIMLAVYARAQTLSLAVAMHRWLLYVYPSVTAE